jgi:hypothetical protein
MKAPRFSILLLVGLLATAGTTFAQMTGGQLRAGFSVESLIGQISLYLPTEATQGMYSGLGRGGSGGGAGQTAGQTQGTARPGAGGFRALFQFARDEKLFLTKDQLGKVLAVFVTLKASPMPTPSTAREIQASIDTILTAAQKAEFVDYQKQLQKAIDQLRQQYAANGGSGAGGQTGQSGQTSQTGQQRSGANAASTPLERRQREVDQFIKVLEDRLKQVGA